MLTPQNETIINRSKQSTGNKFANEGRGHVLLATIIIGIG